MRGAESIAGARWGLEGPRGHIAPLGSLADDKVAQLRVNLCYHLRLVIVSGVLVPTEQPTFSGPQKRKLPSESNWLPIPPTKS